MIFVLKQPIFGRLSFFFIKAYNVLFFHDFIVGQLNVIHLHIFMYLEIFFILVDRGLIDLIVLILLFPISAKTKSPCK